MDDAVEVTDGNSNLSGVTTEPGKMKECEGANHFEAGQADQSENNVIFSSPSTSYKGKNDVCTEIAVYENHEISDDQNAMGMQLR